MHQPVYIIVAAMFALVMLWRQLHGPGAFEHCPGCGGHKKHRDNCPLKRDGPW